MRPADPNIVPKEYLGTPIGDLMEYHNLARPYDVYTDAKLLIGMCMDNRKVLKRPEQFAFVLRTGGANMRYSEFKISFSIAIAGIKHIALIGHTECRMTNLESRREDFIKGMIENAGWTRQRADEYFSNFAPMFEITDAQEFVYEEAKRLREKYPGIMVAPFLYRLDDGKIYPIIE